MDQEKCRKTVQRLAPTCLYAFKPFSLIHPRIHYVSVSNMIPSIDPVSGRFPSPVSSLDHESIWNLCADIAPTLWRHCDDIVSALCRLCADIGPNLSRHCGDILPTLARPCFDLVPKGNPHLVMRGCFSVECFGIQLWSSTLVEFQLPTCPTTHEGLIFRLPDKLKSLVSLSVLFQRRYVLQSKMRIGFWECFEQPLGWCFRFEYQIRSFHTCQVTAPKGTRA